MGRLQRPVLILASGSPRRRAILRAAGVRLRVVVSGVDENIAEKRPRQMVLKLARAKALAVAANHPAELVLGADTTVYCAGRILGKPESPADAACMIELQSGRWQRVYTGVALARGRRVWSEVAVTRVKTRKLNAQRLKRLAGKHMDKAGGYSAQDRQDPFIERIVGDRDNVVGLPMRVVRRLLAKAAAAR
jgi:septum formation protein